MARYPHLSRFSLEGNSDRQIARSALTKTETTQFENHHLDHISGGERQRVMLAKALAQHARVLLLDEPVASLDLRHQLLAMETLRSEVTIRNIAAIVVLHDISLAGRYCDRITLLSAGKVAAEGTPSDVFTLHRFREVFGVDASLEDDGTGHPHVRLIGATPSP